MWYRNTRRRRTTYSHPHPNVSGSPRYKYTMIMPFCHIYPLIHIIIFKTIIIRHDWRDSVEEFSFGTERSITNQRGGGGWGGGKANYTIWAFHSHNCLVWSNSSIGARGICMNYTTTWSIIHLSSNYPRN